MFKSNKYVLVTDYGCYSDAGYNVTIVDKFQHSMFKKEHDYVKAVYDNHDPDFEDSYDEYIKDNDIDEEYKYYSLDYGYNFNELQRVIIADEAEAIDIKEFERIYNDNHRFYLAAKYYIESNNLTIEKVNQKL